MKSSADITILVLSAPDSTVGLMAGWSTTFEFDKFGICGTLKINTTDFREPLTFPIAPPLDWFYFKASKNSA